MSEYNNEHFGSYAAQKTVNELDEPSLEAVLSELEESWLPYMYDVGE